MKPILCFALMAVVALGGVPAASAAAKRPASDREQLIGAWRLVSMDEPGPDGKVNSIEGLTGTLIYTRDGHMSVQIMYPPSSSAVSNDYVLNGYEASFGSYDIDEAKHTITHHVQGSITRGLVGKDLTRVYQVTGNRRLIIKSTRPDEHWSVVWEHD